MKNQKLINKLWALKEFLVTNHSNDPRVEPLLADLVELRDHLQTEQVVQLPAGFIPNQAGGFYDEYD